MEMSGHFMPKPFFLLYTLDKWLDEPVWMLWRRKRTMVPTGY
jgi:hypothetical protein